MSVNKTRCGGAGGSRWQSAVVAEEVGNDVLLIKLTELSDHMKTHSFLQQPSWYVQCLLFSLCQEMNRVSGHTLPKVTLQELLRTCMAEVLAAYEKLVEEKQEKVREQDQPLLQLAWDGRVTGHAATRTLLLLRTENICL